MTPPTAENAGLRRVRERNGEVRGQKCANTENSAKAGFRKEKKEQKGGEGSAPPGTDNGTARRPVIAIAIALCLGLDPHQSNTEHVAIGPGSASGPTSSPPQKMDDGRWTPLPDGNYPPPVLPYLHLRFLLPHLYSRWIYVLVSEAEIAWHRCPQSFTCDISVFFRVAPLLPFFARPQSPLFRAFDTLSNHGCPRIERST